MTGIARVGRFVLSFLTLFLVASCAQDDPGEARPPGVFQHDFAAKPSPWTGSDFDDSEDKFTFAVFSDLTGGERDGIFEIAVAQLSLLRPELILSVGDLIEGGTTDRRRLADEWDSFDTRAGMSRAPVFHVGGNHDLTNAVMRDVWEQRYGARYYHFKYKDVLFLVLDTEDYAEERLQKIYLARVQALERVDAEGWDVFADTEYAKMPEQKTGEVGAGQAAYFLNVIADHPEVNWTFMFMHKAAWKKRGEENFAAIESALSSRPYTVFHGHVHAYEYEKRNGRDYIRLGTTGGVQFADRNLSVDHVTLVTVSREGADIANLKMSGIFDKTGHVPLGGDEVCFDASACGQ